ncbi:hypothetical protein HJC23_002504 [Cyclotella cryptica]|uniref:Isochorismatase-like domain-containing protein n=1 Tax=Cyclotella cryptica TaxID=29204 RepID=A0ABD3R309_9STRA
MKNRSKITSSRISAPLVSCDGKNGSRRSFSVSTDIVDFTGGRNQYVSRINSELKKLGMESTITSSNSNESEDGDTKPLDHSIEIVLATKENTRNVGWFISNGNDAIDRKIGIPLCGEVSEEGDFAEADWKDEPLCRQSKIKWRDDTEIAWLERQVELTQGFILMGDSPGLVVLGEPTHDREDLSETERHFPDTSRLKGYIFPARCGIIIKKGSWHNFPVSVGPDITFLRLNAREAVDALMGMKEIGPIDFRDCYKVQISDKFQNITLRYPDPRPIAKALGLLPDDSISTQNRKKCEGTTRVEVKKWGGNRSSNVWVVPIINVEAFNPDDYGPSIQPHLNKTQPEVANSGWRDYGNRRGLRRLGNLFSKHNIACTAVVSSDLVRDDLVMDQLHRLKREEDWEIGAHGANNSSGGHAGLSAKEEETTIADCIRHIETAFGCNNNLTWLTPGFSVTNSTSKLLLEAGVTTLLDFVDDDEPFRLTNEDQASDQSMVCLPYSMETNDFSLILTRNLSPREYAAAVESHILELAKESRESGSPTVVCLGMHTFVAGTPAVVHELDKMLARLSHASNISWATAEQVSNAVNDKTFGEATPTINSALHSSSSSDFGVQGAIPRLKCQSMSCEQNNIISIPARPSSFQSNRNNIGLILIDLQQDFMSPEGYGQELGNDPSKLRHIIQAIEAVLNSARSAGLMIIHTRESHRSNLADLSVLKASNCPSIGVDVGKGRMMVRGEWGSKFIPELAPLDDGSETVIDKPGKSSFYQTDLELVLQNAQVDTLIVCGVTTEVCVHSTVRDAADRGIKCIVLEDCTASYFDEFHEVGIKMISAQNGIFGSVSDSRYVIDALSRLGNKN